MKRIRYSKYVPDPAGEMSMEDLLSALSNYLLQSGFQSDMWYEMPGEGEQNLDDLKRAIEQALMDSEQFDEEMRERMLEMAMNGQLDELIEKLIERMQQEDYISIDRPYEVQPPDPSRPSGAGGQVGENQQQAKFEITDKSLDFSASSLSATCSARWANPASDATTRATSQPVSKPAAHPAPTSSATRSTSTSPPRSRAPSSAKASRCP